MKVTRLPEIPVKDLNKSTADKLDEQLTLHNPMASTITGTYNVIKNLADIRLALEKVLLYRKFKGLKTLADRAELVQAEKTTTSKILDALEELFDKVDSRGGLLEKGFSKLLNKQDLNNFLALSKKLPNSSSHNFSTSVDSVVNKLTKKGLSKERNLPVLFKKNILTGEMESAGFGQQSQSDAAILNVLLFSYLMAAYEFTYYLLYQMLQKGDKITAATLKGREFQLVPRILAFYKHCAEYELDLHLPPPAVDEIQSLLFNIKRIFNADSKATGKVLGEVMNALLTGKK